MPSLVSIIIPCYNKAVFLADALDSVLCQTYQHWECIIINDGSPDNTEEIALKYCMADTRIQYFSQLNQGVSVARNNGIKQSHGSFILALDADDWISPTYIEEAVTYLIDHPSVKLAYCRYEIFGPNGSFEWVLPEYTYERFILGEAIIVCSAIYRRTDFDRIGGYDENMQGYEDWDFWLRLLNEYDKVYRINQILFHYRSGSSVVSKMVIEDIKTYSRIICQKHPDIYMPLYVDILYYHHFIQENEELKRELKRIQSVYKSKAYRLGKFLLKPLSRIKSLLYL